MVLGLFPGFVRPAFAREADDRRETAEQQVAAVLERVGEVSDLVKRVAPPDQGPDQRIADAALLLGAKDYPRAATILNEVLEKYASKPSAHADALRLLGETYYRSGQLLSARRAFVQVVDKAKDPAFAPFQAEALIRLVDIAVRTEDLASLDRIFAAMAKVDPGASRSALAYARAKGHLVRQEHARAEAALADVDVGGELGPQALYLRGVIALERMPPAASQQVSKGALHPRYVVPLSLFRQVTELPSDTPEHRSVVEQAWLAVGRISLENDLFQEAVDAYAHIERSSPLFSEMLYELAWVHVRSGDSEKAQRALELLAVADPSAGTIAEGSLLRADLLLRTGAFERALRLYENIRSTYEPMTSKVEAFLGAHRDPAVFYDRLSRDGEEGESSKAALPALAVDWARAAEHGPTAFAVIDDVVQSRELLQESESLIERLNLVLGSPNRVRGFPELQRGEELALGLLNRVGMARLILARGLDAIAPGALPGPIGEARAKRRDLTKRASMAPVTEVDFQQREGQALRQWNQASQALQRLALNVDASQAMVNGMRRMLREPHGGRGAREPAEVARLEGELVEREKELATSRSTLEELRSQVAQGRASVGFGDQRFVEDAQVRKALREALVREVELAAEGHAGAEARAYARSLQPILQRADQADAQLEGAIRAIDAQVERNSDVLRAAVAAEVERLELARGRLKDLDASSRELVGKVAMRNFGLVRDKLRGIVLRADVGIVEHAWEVREEQSTRVRHLGSERAREVQVLRRELEEVLDDAGEGEPKASSSPPSGIPGGSP